MRAVHVLLLALAATFTSYVSAASSSTGAPSRAICTLWNYTLTHNTSMPVSAVLANPANLPPADDAVAQVDLPFNFTFYGEQYTSIEVSTNGNIQFQSTSIAWVDSIFPINLTDPTQQVPIIAMYYVDLNPDLDWMQQTAVVGSAPNRHVFVRYNSVPVCPFDQDATHNDTVNDTSIIDIQPSVTCDVILYENDSHIDIRYFNVDPTPWPVDVGLQGNGPDDWTAAVDHEPMTESVVQWLANSTLTFTPTCLQWQQSVAPVGGSGTSQGAVMSSSAAGSASSGGMASTGASMSSGGMAATSVTTPPARGSQTNGAKSSTASVGLFVAVLSIALHSSLL